MSSFGYNTRKIFLYNCYYINGAAITVKNDLKGNPELLTDILHNVLDQIPSMIWKTNSKLECEYVNKTWERFTGLSLEGVSANCFSKVVHPEDIQLISKIMLESSENRASYRIETRLRRHDGEFRQCLLTGTPFYDLYGKFSGYIGFFYDVTDSVNAEQEIQRIENSKATLLSDMLHLDAMSGLYNRSYFIKEFERLNDAGRLPISVIICDINGLKYINDSLGNETGDKVIIETAEILKSCLRHGDILARIGGDEFSILLPGTDYEQASISVEKIIALCEECRINRTDNYNISISLGYATRTSMNQSISGVIKEAEDNMHFNKLLQSKSLYSSIVSLMKKTLYAKSQETEEHARRLIELSKKIGHKLNLKEQQMNELELLSTLHDIGKIGIEDNILNKADDLTEEEWIIMKKHPEIGYRIAKSTPELNMIADYILSHHERWDENGYPNGLKYEEIPLLSRILSVVDAFDAMTVDRIYRKGMTKSEAIEEIRRNSGTQFDPEIVRIFIETVILNNSQNRIKNK